MNRRGFFGAIAAGIAGVCGLRLKPARRTKQEEFARAVEQQLQCEIARVLGRKWQEDLIAEGVMTVNEFRRIHGKDGA